MGKPGPQHAYYDVWVQKLTILLNWLVEPSDSIQDIAQRRKASLLSGMLLVFLGIFLATNLISSSVFADYDLTRRLITTLIVGGLYLLSRSRFFQLSAVLVPFLFSGGVFAILLVGDAPDPDRYLLFLIISLLLGDLLLSIRSLLTLGVFNLVVIIAVLLLLPGNINDLGILPSTIATNIFAAVLVVYSRILHRQIEHDRVEAVTKSEERFNQLADNIQEVLWIIEPKVTRILYISPSFERVWGSPVADFYEDAELFVNSIYPEDREKIIYPRLARQMAGEKTLDEYRIVRPDGEIRWIYDRGFPIKDKNGVVFQVMGLAEDITERKKVERQVRDSERLLRVVTDKFPRSFISVINADFTVGFTAGQGFEQSNQDPERFVGLQIKDVFSEFGQDTLEKITKTYRKTFEGTPQNDEIKMGEVYFSVETVPLKGDNGEIPQILAVVANVTERRMAEVSLKRSQDLFSKLFLANPDALFLSRVDDGIIVEANKGAESVLGFTKQEMIGRSGLDLNIYDDKKKRIKMVSTLEKQGYLRDYEMEINNKEGRRRNLLVSIEIIPIDNESFLLSAVRDVTEQKAIEADLAFQAYILENLGEGLNYVDQDGIIQFTNPAFDKMFGYERWELIGQHVSILNDLSPKENEKLVQLIFTTLEEKGTWRGEVNNRKKDGTSFFTLARIQTMLHGDKSYWVTFQEDLTERSNLEEQLRQAQKLEAVGQLTAGIAHDFNNLLTAISISAEMIKFVLPENDPQLKKVDRILDAGQLAANLINQLMIFSKSQILEPKPLNLNEIVDHISKLLTRVIGEHIQFVFLPSRDLWPIKVDRTQIEQIVVNLAVNSRDAMVDGGILTIQTNNIFLDDTASSGGLFEVGPGEYVLLTISDTGVGMSDKVKEKIFEPFFTTKELGRGTGLGLATVYSIVKDIGGDIRVQSEVGQGTIFKIYIPRTEGLELVAPVIMELSSLPKGNETILLVEDEEGVRLPILEVLQMQGYTVLEAHDGREALEMARIHGSKIDLVLTDVVMPRLSGRSLVERLSESMQDLKIVYMSGYNDEEISHHGVLNSGVEFLQKPFDFPTLTQKIREVLDN